MSLQSVKCLVAKQTATAARYEVFGLQGKKSINWSKLILKTLALRAIDLNVQTGYLTTDQENQMLAKISNPNINL